MVISVDTSITPADGVEIVLLGAAEAREQADDIKQRGDDLKVRIWTWYTRKGWKALGYESFAESAEPELGMVFQTAYSYVVGYEVEQALSAENSPQGETSRTSLPLKHAKQLGKLKSAPLQIEAHAKAWELATTQGDERPTEKHYQVAVETIQRKQATMKYAVVGNMVTTGTLSIDDGEKMCAALERIKPQIRGELVKLIATHTMTCPDLVQPIAAMYGRESKVLPEVLTGFLGGVPLRKATTTDLSRANYEARLQHIADDNEAKRQANEPIEHVITVYEGDPAKTFAALKRVLKAQDLIVLQRLIEEQA